MPWTIAGAAAGGFYFLFPVLAVLAPLGVAPLGLVAALVLAALTWKRRPWAAIPRWPAALMGAVLVFALISALWSPDAIVSIKASLQLAGIVLAALALFTSLKTLEPGEIRALALGGIAGLAAAALFLVADRALDSTLTARLHGLTGASWQVLAEAATKRGASVVSVLAWPLAWVALRQWGVRAAGLVLGLGAVAVLSAHSGSATGGLAAAALATVIAWRLPLRWLAAGSILALALATPFLAGAMPDPQVLWDMYPWIPHSAHHRLTIWHHAAQLIDQKPILGWGMDASRLMPDEVLRVHHWVGSVRESLDEPLLPLHPHNAFLQWRLELGLPGALLMGLLAARLALAGFTFPLAFAGLVAGLAASASSFGAWQSWWLLSLSLAAGLAGAARKA